MNFLSFLNKEKIKNLIKLVLKRENFFPIIITAIFFVGLKFLGGYFLNVMWIIVGIMLVILIFVIMTLAGFTVLKSLFRVAAGLSLMIFLAKSYCDIPVRETAGDNALKSLLLFGLLYILFIFTGFLRQALNKHYKKIKKEKWSQEKITVVTLFLMFIGLFIWEIYLIIKPIILNLCII